MKKTLLLLSIAAAALFAVPAFAQDPSPDLKADVDKVKAPTLVIVAGVDAGPEPVVLFRDVVIGPASLVPSLVPVTALQPQRQLVPAYTPHRLQRTAHGQDPPAVVLRS
jgi:hypothetical protein